MSQNATYPPWNKSFLPHYCTKQRDAPKQGIPLRIILKFTSLLTFIRILLFPCFQFLSSEAKLLYAMILRRTDLSRKNGWADDYGKIYLYYPINEVCELLHCGRQKAVDTLRELQYADLVSIKKQGCGKPNRIYPKHYEAVSNTDFKKSGYGTPEV